MNHIRIIVLMVLNRVWNIESPSRGLNSPISPITALSRAMNGLNKANAHITPKRLKMVCVSAVRFAFMFPIAAAMLAVMVVPMFSPKTIAAPISNGIQPSLSIMSVIAIVALEDWSTRVRIVPKRTKIRMLPKPQLVQLAMNDRTSGVLLRSGTEDFIKDSPRKSREKPMMNSPMLWYLSFLNCIRTKPSRKRGMESAAMSNLKPSREMIQAVTVVPILAPIMTPMACFRVRSPALTKLTTSTVVALDD